MINNTQPEVPLPGFTFGADPEFFILDDKDVLVTAEGLLPGTKEEPFLVEGGAIQVDGMAAEFNVDPSATYQEFSSNVDKVVNTLKSMLPTGFNLSTETSVIFSPEEWIKAPSQAKVLGCSPDYNAWTFEVNHPPNAAKNPRLRTASGHIHFGWTESESLSDFDHLQRCSELVQQLDYYLGGWSLQIDKDSVRRQLYGQAGACRFKTYGVEYRVLSNFWVLDENIRRQVWDRMNLAIKSLAKGHVSGKNAEHDEMLIKSINTSTRIPELEQKYSFPILTTNH